MGVCTLTRGGGGGDVCCPSAHASYQPMGSASPSPHPFLLSLPSQEVDCHGNVVQERVEQAMEEIKDRLTFLEKRGRAEVGEELEANDSAHVPIVTLNFLFCSRWWKHLYTHTLMPASMTRQVGITVAHRHMILWCTRGNRI